SRRMHVVFLCLHCYSSDTRCCARRKPGAVRLRAPGRARKGCGEHDERTAESGTGMETQPAWSILAAIGAAAASGGGARTALDDAVQRLAAQCAAAVDVWAATDHAGELRHLAGGASALAAVTTPAEQPALARSLATLKTVVGPAGST